MTTGRREIERAIPTHEQVVNFTEWLNALVNGFKWSGSHVEDNYQHRDRYEKWRSN